MSTFFLQSKTCAVCGNTVRLHVIGSTNAFGSPDLDLRPPEMKRSTMSHWPEECPQCGYASYDLEAETAITAQWLSQPLYTTCEGIEFASRLAESFYKIYLIARQQQDLRCALNSLLHAAWACDDYSDTENATHCRKLLLPWLEREIAENPDRAETMTVVRADVLRRAGLFDQVIAEYATIEFSEPLLTSICRFQVEKAKLGDTACYRICDVKDSE